MKTELRAASFVSALSLCLAALSACSSGAPAAGGDAGTTGTAGVQGAAGSSAGGATGAAGTGAPSTGAAGTNAVADAPFAGTWVGKYLAASATQGDAKLTTTLTGTTVGGIAEMSGSKKSDLTGTFMAGNFKGSYFSTSTFMFDLNVKGPFLIGLYGFSDLSQFVTTMRASTAAPGPATFPAKLVGTWKSLKSTKAGTITITLADAQGMLTGHVDAPGLAEADGFFTYDGGVLGGGNANYSIQLLASGTHFLGGYGDGSNEVGIVDVTAQ